MLLAGDSGFGKSQRGVVSFRFLWLFGRAIPCQRIEPGGNGLCVCEVEGQAEIIGDYPFSFIGGTGVL